MMKVFTAKIVILPRHTSTTDFSYGNLLLFNFQTTFAAFLGDWTLAGQG